MIKKVLKLQKRLLFSNRSKNCDYLTYISGVEYFLLYFYYHIIFDVYKDFDHQESYKLLLS